MSLSGQFIVLVLISAITIVGLSVDVFAQTQQEHIRPTPIELEENVFYFKDKNADIIENYNTGLATAKIYMHERMLDYTDFEGRPVWVDYKVREDASKVYYESASRSYIFDKASCALELYDGGKLRAGQQRNAVLTHVVKEAQNGTDVWYDMELNADDCDVDIVKRPFGIQLVSTKSDFVIDNSTGDNGTSTGHVYKEIYDIGVGGFMEWTYDFELKDENKDGQYKHGFTAVCTGEVCSNVSLDGEVVGIGETVQKDQLVENGGPKGKPIQIGAGRLDLKNEQHDMTWVVKHPATDQLVMDFTHAKASTKLNERIVVDPAIFDNPTVDGHWTDTDVDTNCETSPGSTGSNTAGSTMQVGLEVTANGADCYISVLEYPVSSLPDDASIQNIDFNFDVTNKVGTVTSCDVYDVMTHRPSTALEGDVWSDASGGALYADDNTECATVGDNKSVQFGTQAKLDLKSQLTNGDWFAFSIVTSSQLGTTGIGSQNKIEIATEEDTGATPKPTLEVTYAVIGEPPNPPVTLSSAGGLNKIDVWFDASDFDGEEGSTDASNIQDYHVYTQPGSGFPYFEQFLPDNNGQDYNYSANIPGRLDFGGNQVLYHFEEIITSQSYVTEPIATYQNDNGGSEAALDNTYTIEAQTVESSSVFKGKTVTKLSLWLKQKLGTPTGIATIGVFDSSGNTLFTFGTIDVSTLTGTFTEYEFENTVGYTLSTGEYIGIKWPNGDSSNKITPELDTGDNFDGANSNRARYSGSWSESASVDLRFRLYQGNPDNSSLVTDSSGNGINGTVNTSGGGAESFWFHDKFATDGWSQTGTTVIVDEITDERIESSSTTRGSDHRVVYDKTSDPIDPDVDDFIMDVTWRSTGGGTGLGYAVGVAEVGNNRIGLCVDGEDFIGVVITSAGSTPYFRIIICDNGTVYSDAENIEATLNETFYLRLEYDADSQQATLNVYTDSARTIHHTNSPHTISGFTASNLANLGYMYVGANSESAPSGGYSSWQDDLMICKTETTGDITDCAGAASTMSDISGLVHYYQFDEVENKLMDRCVYTASTDCGAPLDGTNSGVTQGTDGLIGNMFDYATDGADTAFSDDWFTVGDYNDNSFSINMWFNGDYTPSTNGYLLGWNNGGNSRVEIYQNSNSWIACIVGDGTSAVEAEYQTDVLDGTWHMATCVVDHVSDDVIMYVDAVERARTPLGTLGAPSGLSNRYIGNYDGGTGNDHSGKIDEVSFWHNRALSSSAINELYNSNNGLDLTSSASITNNIYDGILDSQDSYYTLHSGAFDTSTGIQIEAGHAGVGETIQTIELLLKRTGSPTGNAEVGVWRSGAFVSTGLLDVSTVPTSNTHVAVTMDEAVTIQTDDIIGIRYTGGDASNYIQVGDHVAAAEANTEYFRSTDFGTSDASQDDRPILSFDPVLKQTGGSSGSFSLTGTTTGPGLFSKSAIMNKAHITFTDSNNSIRSTNDWITGLWYRLDSDIIYPNYGTVLGFNSTNDFEIRLGNSTVALYSGSTEVKNSTWNHAVGAWNHIMLSRDGNNFEIFGNGTELDTDTVDSINLGTPTDNKYYLGARPSQGMYLNATIDEFFTGNTTLVANLNGQEINVFKRGDIDSYTWVYDHSTNNSTSTQLTGLGAGETKHIRVDADNGVYNSTRFAVTSATTDTVPDAPTNVVATAVGTDQIDLTWDAGASNGGDPVKDYGIRYVNVTRGDTAWNTLVANSTLVNRWYNHTGLLNAVEITYQVREGNSVGWSAWSANATAQTFGPPNPPTGLVAATISNSQIDLSWTAPGGPITGYKIERESPVGGGWTTIVADTGNDSTNYSDSSGLSGGIQYNYRVTAINSYGSSSPSSPAANYTSPDAPTGLTATPVLPTQIDLSWTPPSGNYTGFKIERESPVGGGWSVIVADTGSIATTYSDSGLSQGTQYNYRVSAINSGGTSSPSTAANASTFNPPNEPTGLTASSTTGAPLDINLSWTAPNNLGDASSIVGYRIYKESPVGGGWSVLVNSTGSATTSYTDPGNSNNTQYNYMVAAWGDCAGCLGANSTAANFTTPNVPGAPTGVTATIKSGNTSVEVSWTAPASDGGNPVIGYKIDRRMNGGGWALLVSNTGSTATTYTDSGLTDGNIYEYRVYAINNVGTGPVSSGSNQVEFTVASLTLHIEELGGSTIKFTPEVTINNGIPDPTVTNIWLRKASDDSLVASITPNTVVSKGSSQNFTAMYDYPSFDTYYYIVVRTTNGESGQIRDFQSSNGLAQPMDPFSGSISATERRATNYTESILYFVAQPTGEDVVVRYQHQDQTQDPFYRNYYNVEAAINATIPVLSNIDYYISFYYAPTFSYSGSGTNSSATIPNGYESDLTLRSLRDPDSQPQLGIESMGDLFGLPMVFVFIIAVAAIFTGRSAPMGVMIIGVMLGVMAYLGYISFDFDPSNNSNVATWAIIIVAIILGLVIGKRWD